MADVAADRGWRMRTGIEPAEERVLTALAGLPSGVVAVSRQVTRLGDRTPVWAAVAVAGVATSIRVRRPVPAVAALATLACGAGARAALAVRLGRERPPERLWKMEWSGPSFPSRHTTLATLGAGLVAGTLATGRPGLARAVLWAPAAAAGLSRLVLGVHWPTDVVGGWLFGAGVLAASHRVRAAAGIARR